MPQTHILNRKWTLPTLRAGNVHWIFFVICFLWLIVKVTGYIMPRVRHSHLE